MYKKYSLINGIKLTTLICNNRIFISRLYSKRVSVEDPLWLYMKCNAKISSFYKHICIYMNNAWVEVVSKVKYSLCLKCTDMAIKTYTFWFGWTNKQEGSGFFLPFYAWIFVPFFVIIVINKMKWKNQQKTPLLENINKLMLSGAVHKHVKCKNEY